MSTPEEVKGRLFTFLDKGLHRGRKEGDFFFYSFSVYETETEKLTSKNITSVQKHDFLLALTN